MTRVMINGKRHYDSPTGPLPSVTTILSKTATAEKTEVLENWRKRIGYAEAAQQTQEAANLGTIMHDTLESLLVQKDFTDKKNFIHKLGVDMACVIYDNSVRHMKEVWGVEVPIFYEGLYAGTADLIGLSHDNKRTIYDFKNSKKIKKREWLTDYFLQGAAYSSAHDNMDLGCGPIEQVSILMCSRDLEFKEFILDTDEFEEHKVLWSERVAQYYDTLR